MSNAWDDLKKAKEEEYFHKKEKELLKKKHDELHKEEFKENFQWHCPRCAEELVQQDSSEGVYVHACESCKGVWLDKKELDKLTDDENAASWFEKFWGSR